LISDFDESNAHESLLEPRRTEQAIGLRGNA